MIRGQPGWCWSPRGAGERTWRVGETQRSGPKEGARSALSAAQYGREHRRAGYVSAWPWRGKQPTETDLVPIETRLRARNRLLDRVRVLFVDVRVAKADDDGVGDRRETGVPVDQVHPKGGSEDRQDGRSLSAVRRRSPDASAREEACQEQAHGIERSHQAVKRTPRNGRGQGSASLLSGDVHDFQVASFKNTARVSACSPPHPSRRRRRASNFTFVLFLFGRARLRPSRVRRLGRSLALPKTRPGGVLLDARRKRISLLDTSSAPLSSHDSRRIGSQLDGQIPS
jgi:hypothetical protein